MKKWVLLVVVVLGVAIAASSDRYTWRLGSTVLLTLSPDQSELDAKCRRFLTDIQYKDFAHAAKFHGEDAEGEKNLATLIERKFVVKPELLDIKSFEILRIDVSPTGDRAKVITQVTVKMLNANQLKDTEAIFYFKKTDGGWLMDLKSSL